MWELGIKWKSINLRVSKCQKKELADSVLDAATANLLIYSECKGKYDS